MGKYRKPLNRVVLVSLSLFLAALCLALTAAQYASSRRTLYGQYRNHMRSILRCAASGIDADELAACIRRGAESEITRELQPFLEQLRESCGLSRLYIVIPPDAADYGSGQHVPADAVRSEGDVFVRLDSLRGDADAPDAAKEYLLACSSGGLRCFEQRSGRGVVYTGLLPLCDSAGSPVAAVCADADSTQLRALLRAETAGTLLMSVLLCGLFAAGFTVWTARRITRPLRRLESSVMQLAEHSRELPSAVAPGPVSTVSEIEALARAVGKLSETLRAYVACILQAESELARLSALAHRDALTHVKNKAAYEQCCEQLQRRFGEAGLQFAILMADVNGLKRVNDVYGHERGDTYLINCCSVLCEIFRDSPIFRIGGDEFVAVLTGREYEAREALLEKARRACRKLLERPYSAPWEKASVSLGLAAYRPGADRRVKDVFERADRLMYREKETTGKNREKTLDTVNH